MVVLLKDGQPDESLDYWRRLVCVNGLNGVAIAPETYNLAIKCATRAGNLEEMEAVVDMMEVFTLGMRLIFIHKKACRCVKVADTVPGR